MDDLTYIRGTVLDEESFCGFGELCRVCGTDAELIREMVAEGIISPESDRQGANPEEWRFTLTAIQRVQTVTRLTRDLRINLPGCALVLDLLDELAALRALAARTSRS